MSVALGTDREFEGAVAVIDPRSTDSRTQHVLFRAVIELVIAGSVFVVYRAGRLVTSDSITTARTNAARVLDAQRSITGTLELHVQHWMLDLPGAIHVLNHYYVFVHFPATTIFLVWAFARHRHRYPTIRNWFVGVTLTAMVIHVIFPLAPPRMLPGYVDTLREYGPNIYPEDPSRSLANQFAAMPSLHFGWALMVAVAIIAVTTNRYRWWSLTHPAVTLLAIVATANHYLLDAAVATALAAVIGLLVLPRNSNPVGPIEALALPAAPLTAPHHRPAPRHPQRRCADQTRTAAATTPNVRSTPRPSCRDDDPVTINS